MHAVGRCCGLLRRALKTLLLANEPVFTSETNCIGNSQGKPGEFILFWGFVFGEADKQDPILRMLLFSELTGLFQVLGISHASFITYFILDVMYFSLPKGIYCELIFGTIHVCFLSSLNIIFL